MALAGPEGTINLENGRPSVVILSESVDHTVGSLKELRDLDPGRHVRMTTLENGNRAFQYCADKTIASCLPLGPSDRPDGFTFASLGQAQEAYASMVERTDRNRLLWAVGVAALGVCLAVVSVRAKTTTNMPWRTSLNLDTIVSRGFVKYQTSDTEIYEAASFWGLTMDQYLARKTWAERAMHGLSGGVVGAGIGYAAGTFAKSQAVDSQLVNASVAANEVDVFVVPVKNLNETVRSLSSILIRIAP